MDHLSDVETWLINSYNIKVSSDWLSACLEFINQESLGTSLKQEDVKRQVLDQWLCSDLAEIGEKSLPDNVTTCNSMELVSNYPLQILTIVDVGFPLYGQQHKLTGKEDSNESVSADRPFQPGWEPKQSRMLLLTLTDGHTEIKALEYQPIRSLHTQVPSGTKVMLMGTISCRRGIVLLTEEHVQVLGGEVDTLSETNTPLVQLQQAMEKNREDSGKTDKHEFSGRFITRAKKDKFESHQKPNIKKEDPGCSYKKDIKHVQIFTPNVKPEVKKDLQDEWEDDINYEELFDDAMEFEDECTSVQSNLSNQQKRSLPCQQTPSSAKNQQTPSSAKSRQNPSSAKSQQTPPSTNTSFRNRNNSSPKEMLKLPENFDDFDDDDDFEMNAMCSTSPISKSSIMKTPMSKRVSPKLESKTQGSSQSISDINNSTPNNCHSMQVTNSSERSNNITNKMSISSCSDRNVSPTFSSPLSSAKRQFSATINKQIPKEENVYGSVQKLPSSEKTTFGKIKKAKIQAKVSDLFKKPQSFEPNCTGDSNSSIGENLDFEKYSMEDSNILVSQKQIPTLNPSIYIYKDVTEKSSKDIGILHSDVKQSDQTSNDSCTKGDATGIDALNQSLTDLTTANIAVCVKASILTLITKLSSNNGCHWSLACRINDGAKDLDVDISNSVLTELIGFSAEESIAMRQRFKTEPQIKEVFAEGLSECQRKLISGRTGCLLQVEPAGSNKHGTRPIIVKFELSKS